MNLQELCTFLEVVDTKSLVAASRRLNVTQSTVTARLNALEEALVESAQTIAPWDWYEAAINAARPPRHN